MLRDGGMSARGRGRDRGFLSCEQSCHTHAGRVRGYATMSTIYPIQS